MPTRAARFFTLPEYPLATIPQKKRELAARGVDVIDLGAGDADLPAPPAVLTRMREAVLEPALSRYGFGLGYVPYRQAVSAWMEKRFGTRFDPFTEVVAKDNVLACGTLLDARSRDRFEGSAPDPRPGVEPGHIPGGRNLPFGLLYNEDGTFKPPNELKLLFAEAGTLDEAFRYHVYVEYWDANGKRYEEDPSARLGMGWEEDFERLYPWAGGKEAA